MRNALRSLFLALAPLGALCAEPRVLEVPEITTVFLSIDGGTHPACTAQTKKRGAEICQKTASLKSLSTRHEALWF